MADHGEKGGLGKLVSDLGKKLQKRQDRDDLVNRNIIKAEKGNLSDSLLQAKITLEKERKQDKLAGRLMRRPSQKELEDRNIIRAAAEAHAKREQKDPLAPPTRAAAVASTKGYVATAHFPSEIAPGIETNSRGFDQAANSVRSILKHRPNKAELQKKNIIKGDNTVDPSLTAMAEKLKRAQLEATLGQKIRARPDMDELVSKGIVFNEIVEILPTYRDTEYNRRPDMDATFRKLTPKLKQEIRDELNAFKRDEMSVHELSASHTSFH